MLRFSCKQVLLLWNGNVVILSCETVTLIIIVKFTSASTNPEHGKDIVNVCTVVGIKPSAVMFNFGVGKAGLFDVSTTIE